MFVIYTNDLHVLINMFVFCALDYSLTLLFICYVCYVQTRGVFICFVLKSSSSRCICPAFKILRKMPNVYLTLPGNDYLKS